MLRASGAAARFLHEVLRPEDVWVETKAPPSICGCRGAVPHQYNCTRSSAACTHGGVVVHTFLLSVCLLPLLLRQGQLESIPSSFLAQTRHSQGPLIKDKPSSSLSVSSTFSLSALSPLFISIRALSHFQLPLSLFTAASFHRSAGVSPRHSSLPPGHLAPASPLRHGGGLIFTSGRSSESICAKSRTCYPALPVLTMCPVTRAV